MAVRCRAFTSDPYLFSFGRGYQPCGQFSANPIAVKLYASP
jgi:hypothetical protein